MNRLLFLTHRWVGIALAIFMFIWFSSGLVIMYSDPSALSPAQQLLHREQVAPESHWLSVGEALSRARTAESVAGSDGIIAAKLVQLAQQPVWLVENTSGQRFALSALDGMRRDISVADAQQIAAYWVQHSAETKGSAPVITHLDTGPQDSSVRNYEPLRPFHRFAVGDTSRELLVSVRTGEVVRDTTALDRTLFWTGNWIHLLRGIETFSSPETRRNTLLYLGLFAVIASLTGLILGWQRWRPGWFGGRTYGQGRVHPYRDTWSVWHFWVGLIGGIAALLWAFSGFLNSNPLRVFSEANPNKQELTRYQGKTLPDIALHWQPTAITGTEATEVVELNWRYLEDQAVLLAVTRQGERIPQAVTGTVSYFSEAELLKAALRFVNNAPTTSAVPVVATHSLQTEYDSYYYPRHHQTLVDKPLPVLRVDLADAAATRLYLDPQDGRVLLKADASRRVYRWLYSALHHWDFGWLYYRPLWDLWMLPLVLMGVVLGLSSVVLGWRRLKVEFKPKKKKRSPAAKPARTAPSAINANAVNTNAVNTSAVNTNPAALHSIADGIKE